VTPRGSKPGEALWPERYPLEVLMSIKADISLYDWEAEYQQSPVRREGLSSGESGSGRWRSWPRESGSWA